MLLIRRLHAYVGLFIAPSVLFLAVSGALQLFHFHEARGSYQPPALFEALGNLHKDQVLEKQHERHGPPKAAAEGAHEGAPAAAPDGEHDDDAHAGPGAATTALKWFFELISFGLIFSTLFGLWVGLKVTRTPMLSWGLLISGALIPILIVSLFVL